MAKTGLARLNARLQKREVPIVWVGMVLIGCFLINDLLGWLYGAGIYSIVSAVNAASDRVPAIFVDGAGLRTIFLAAMSLPYMAISWLAKVNEDHKFWGFGLGLYIAGALVLDVTLGGSIIDGYLTDRGYFRCEPMDYDVGFGRGMIWFEAYVHADQACDAG